MFYVIDRLQLGESRESGGIQLSVTLLTYLRPRTANDKPEMASAAADNNEDEESDQ